MNQQFSAVSPFATIHPSVEIGPFTTIYEDVIIDENTWIGPNVTVFSGARIGKNCQIFPGTVIAAIPQDLKFKGEYSTVEIGDDTTIRECVTVNRGTAYSGKTKIGSNCLIMAYSHIAHDCIIHNDVIISNGVQLAGHVEIKHSAVIGGVCAVHQFVKIGEYSMVGGGSLVRKDVPPFIKASKEPLSFIGVNTIGLKRKGFDNERIEEIKNYYSILYLSNLNTQQAIQKLEVFDTTTELATILHFIKKSKRGIIRKGIEDRDAEG